MILRHYIYVYVQCCLESLTIVKLINPCFIHPAACHTEWSLRCCKRCQSSACHWEGSPSVLTTRCACLKPPFLRSLSKYGLLSLHLKPLVKSQFQLLWRKTVSEMPLRSSKANSIDTMKPIDSKLYHSKGTSKLC